MKRFFATVLMLWILPTLLRAVGQEYTEELTYSSYAAHVKIRLETTIFDPAGDGTWIVKATLLEITPEAEDGKKMGFSVDFGVGGPILNGDSNTPVGTFGVKTGIPRGQVLTVGIGTNITQGTLVWASAFVSREFTTPDQPARLTLRVTNTGPEEATIAWPANSGLSYGHAIPGNGSYDLVLDEADGEPSFTTVGTVPGAAEIVYKIQLPGQPGMLCIYEGKIQEWQPTMTADKRMDWGYFDASMAKPSNPVFEIRIHSGAKPFAPPEEIYPDDEPKKPTPDPKDLTEPPPNQNKNEDPGDNYRPPGMTGDEGAPTPPGEGTGNDAKEIIKAVNNLNDANKARHVQRMNQGDAHIFATQNVGTKLREDLRGVKDEIAKQGNALREALGKMGSGPGSGPGEGEEPGGGNQAAQAREDTEEAFSFGEPTALVGGAPSGSDGSFVFTFAGMSFDMDPGTHFPGVCAWIKAGIAWALTVGWCYWVFSHFREVSNQLMSTPQITGNPIAAGTGAQGTALINAVAFTTIVLAIPAVFTALLVTLDAPMPSLGSLTTSVLEALPSPGGAIAGRLVELLIPWPTVVVVTIGPPAVLMFEGPIFMGAQMAVRWLIA